MLKIFSLTLLLCLIGEVLSPVLAHAQEESSIDSGAAELCSKVFKNSWQAYLDLARFLPKNFKEIPQLPTHKGLHLKEQACQTDPGVQSTIQRALSFHTQKVAIMLPLSLWPAPVTLGVKQQIQAMADRYGWDAQRNLVWVDTAGDPQRLQASLAQLVFQQHVSLLIGGLQQREAPVLAQWSERLRIPSIILNRRVTLPSSPYVYAMAPDPEALARSLLVQMQAKSMHRLAIMMSQSSREQALLEALQKLAPSFSIQLSGPYAYNAQDFDSIDAHLRAILHLDDASRDPERRALLQKMKDKATAEGIPFQQRELNLPPLLEVDAMLILDHFKTVRHLTKALSSYGVKNLALFGTPKWRALELIDPPEPMLKGAYFVDYIGSYQKLPYGIQAKLAQGEFFVEGEEAGLIDLKLLTAHAVYAGMQVAKLESTPRFLLHQNLAQARNENQPFFQQGLIFKANHVALWPSFLFGIEETGLRLVQSFRDVASLKQAYRSSTSVTKPASSQ